MCVCAGLPVVPHKDVVALVVEGDHAAAPELGILGEQRRQLPAQTSTRGCNRGGTETVTKHATPQPELRRT